MTNVKNRFMAALLIFCMVFGIAAAMNTDTAHAASKTHLKKTSIKIHPESSYQQKLLDKNGKVIKASKVTWATKNPDVAIITSKGKITGLRRGTADMTAKYKGKTYKFKVRVASSVWFDTNPLYVKVGETVRYKLHVPRFAVSFTYSDLASVINHKYVEYDSGVVTYEVTGVKEGIRSIRAKVGNSKDTVYIYCEDPTLANSAVNFRSKTLTIKQGKTVGVAFDTDKGCLTRCERDNDNVSVEYGYCEDLGDLVNYGVGDYGYKITGGRIGTTVITLYDLSDPTVMDTLTVEVVK